MVVSIRKGKRFERYVANKLTRITGEKWVRVPQSGAMATNYKLQQFLGDVVKLKVLNGEAKQDLVVECKSVKDPINIQDIYYRNDNIITKWIKQAKCSMDWVVVFKWNRSVVFGVSDKKEVLFDLGFKAIRCLIIGTKKIKYFIGMWY